jgi:hypothetical protein
MRATGAPHLRADADSGHHRAAPCSPGSSALRAWRPRAGLRPSGDRLLPGLTLHWPVIDLEAEASRAVLRLDPRPSKTPGGLGRRCLTSVLGQVGPLPRTRAAGLPQWTRDAAGPARGPPVLVPCRRPERRGADHHGNPERSRTLGNSLTPAPTAHRARRTSAAVRVGRGRQVTVVRPPVRARTEPRFSTRRGAAGMRARRGALTPLRGPATVACLVSG